MHLYWQIAYKCALREIFLFASLDFPFIVVRKREVRLFSRHTKIAFATFSFSIPIFPILSSTRFSFSSFITWRSSWCWSSFRSILSQHFLSVSRRDFFLFFHPRLIHALLKLHLPIYIACGVWLVLPEPLRLGKKLLEISDWLTPFFLPSASSIPQHSLSIGFRFSFVRLLDQSFMFDFCRFSFFDSAAAIKREERSVYVLRIDDYVQLASALGVSWSCSVDSISDWRRAF